MRRHELSDAEWQVIMIAVLCRWSSGEPQAGDDALDACWFDSARLNGADPFMSVDVAAFARQAHALADRESVPTGAVGPKQGSAE